MNEIAGHTEAPRRKNQPPVLYCGTRWPFATSQRGAFTSSLQVALGHQEIWHPCLWTSAQVHAPEFIINAAAQGAPVGFVLQLNALLPTVHSPYAGHLWDCRKDPPEIIGSVRRVSADLRRVIRVGKPSEPVFYERTHCEVRVTQAATPPATAGLFVVGRMVIDLFFQCSPAERLALLAEDP